MAEASLKIGTNWATKESSLLGYNDENGNYKPIPFDFSRASIGTRVNRDGLIEVVQDNIPRIDFSGDGSLLLEPQRTNLFTYSENIPQNFAATSLTDTFEYGVSPNGIQKSTRLQLTSVGTSRYADTITGLVTSGTTYTFSCYYKGTLGETAFMYLFIAGGTSVEKEITFTGEWQREQVTFTAGSSTNLAYIVDTRRGGNASDFEVWGTQLEAGSYSTSVIPTSGSAVTRNADSCDNGGDSNTFNDSEGVLYAEFKNEDVADYRLISISDGTTNNRAFIGTRINTGYIYYFVLVGGVTSSTYISTQLASDFNKVALKYKTNDFALWINGTEVYSDTSGATYSANTLDRLNFDNAAGAGKFVGNCKELRVYNTALTDTELEELTTL